MSIGKKFIIWIIALLTVITVLVAYLYYRLQISEEEERLVYMGNMAGPIIEQSLYNYMMTKDRAVLDETLANLGSKKAISGLWIVNREGVVRVATDKGMIGTTISLDDPRCRGCHEKGKRWVFLRGEQKFRWAQPVANRRECHKCHPSSVRYNGMIAIDFDLQEPARHLKKDITRGFLIFIPSLAAVGFALLLLSKKIVIARLNRMVDTVKRFREGDYGARIFPDGRDEITKLEGGFNEMAEAIVRKDGEKNELIVKIVNERDFSRGLIDSLPGIFYLFDDKGRMLQWNKTLEELSGYSTEKISTLHALDFIVERDREIVARKIEKVFLYGESSVEAHFKTKDGGEIPFFFTGVRGGTEGGLYVVGVGLDITERKAAEKLRLESEEKFRVIFESAKDGIVVGTRERFIMANEAMCGMLGYAHDEITGMGVTDIHPAEELPRILAEFNLHMLGEKTISPEIPVKRKDGSIFYADISSTSIVIAGKSYLAGFFRDVTGRKQTEAKLREHDRQQRAILNNIPDIAWLKDRESRFIAVNQPFGKAAGVTPEALVGKTDFDIWPAELAERYRADDRIVIETGVRKHIEEPFVNSNGQESWIETIKTPIYNDRGEIIGTTGIARDITERKRVEKALLESTKQLNEAQRIAHIGSWEFDIVQDRLVWSEEIFRIFEIDPARFDVSYEAFLNLVHPDDREVVNAAYTNSVRDHTPYEIVHRLRMLDGRIKYVQEVCETMYDAEGRPLRSIGAVQDITERKLSEQRIETQLQRLQKLAEISMAISGEPVDVFTKIVNTIAELLNVPVVCLSEVRGDELYFLSVFVRGNVTSDAGHSPLNITPCATVQTAKEVQVYHEVANKFPEAEFLKLHNAHSYCGFPAVDSEGNVVAVACLLDDKHHDFSDEDRYLLQIFGQRIGVEIERQKLLRRREQAEEENHRNYDTQLVINTLLQLSLEEMPLEEILQGTLDLILSIEWLTLESKGCIFLVEGDPDRLVMKARKGLSEHIQAECRMLPFGRCLCGQAALKQEMQFTDRLDDRHEVHYHGIAPHGHYCVPILFAGKTLGVINMYLAKGHEQREEEVKFLKAIANVLAGIIQRRNVEKEREILFGELQKTFDIVSQAHKEWQDTFDSITDLISIHDKDYNIIRANKAVAAYFGMDVRHIIGRKCCEMFHCSDAPLSNCPHTMAIKDRRSHMKDVVDPKTKKIFGVSTFPFTSPDGKFIGSIHIARDITEEREKEMRLIMNERLAALGQMASGIAHEINNPLASISGCAEGLLDSVQKGQYDQALFGRYLKIILEEIARCKNITTNMLSFVRKAASDKRKVNINEALSKTIEMVEFQGRLHEIDVVRKYQEDRPTIQGNEGELRQVFLSLITNALDAMENRGTLTITTAAEEKAVFVEISDSGPGIAEEYVNSIFDPFFTTKAYKGGTGLGLSIARKIIDSHHGDITVVTALGKGTTFKIRLPRE